MTRATEQRLEAWMREVTDLLCYQPEVPMAHKTALVEAMQNFGRQIEHEDKLRQEEERQARAINAAAK